MPRYIIHGAGAIGSILGAELYRSGREVVLIGSPSHVDAIRRDGLQLKSKGVVRKVKVPAVSHPSHLCPMEGDRLLVTVKTQQTQAAAELLSKVFPRQTTIVSFQNAVRNEEILSRRFDNVYGGLVDFSGNFLRPGCVEHTRNNLVALGQFPRGFDLLANLMGSDLERAGFRVDRSEEVMTIKWWKLVLNTNNATLAILDCWLQKVFSDPEIYPLMAAVFEESLAVVRKSGIQPQSPRGVPLLETAIQDLRTGAMACPYDLPFDERTYPSTWQDLHLKRGETEVNYLNGEIERLGRNLDIPTPSNSTLLKIVADMSSRRELPGKYTPRELQKILEEAK